MKQTSQRQVRIVTVRCCINTVLVDPPLGLTERELFELKQAKIDESNDTETGAYCNCLMLY